MMMRYDQEKHLDGVAKCAELLRRAILTLDALPDPDARFFAQSNGWPEIKREVKPSEGHYEIDASPTPVRVRFRPTTKDVSNCLPVLEWLSWFQRTQNMGKRDTKIIFAHVHGASWRKIGDIHGRDKNTVKRWYEGSITVIYSKFYDEIEKIN